MAQPKIVGIKRTGRGNLDLLGNSEDQSNFENYLLKFEVSRFQKFMARLGREVFIGDFRAEKPCSGFEHYFLFWCQVHRKYVVSYFHGEERRLDCPECNSEFIAGIHQNIPNDKKEKRLRLVKSNNWPKT